MNSSDNSITTHYSEHMAKHNPTRTPDVITPERGTRAQTPTGGRTNTPQIHLLIKTSLNFDQS